jgi:hypothetical protein
MFAHAIAAACLSFAGQRAAALPPAVLISKAMPLGA